MSNSPSSTTPLLDEICPGKSATLPPEYAAELEKKIGNFTSLLTEIMADAFMKQVNLRRMRRRLCETLKAAMQKQLYENESTTV